MFKQLILRHKSITASIVGLILFALIPLFVQSPYYLDMFIVVIVNAVLAMTFIMMLRSGLMSLGIGAFWGIGAYISVVLVMNLHLSFWLSLPLTALITGCFAAIIGYFLISRGAGGINFIMITAVIGMLFVVIIGNIEFLGGYYGIPNVPGADPINLPFMTIDFSSKVDYFYLALFLFVVAVLITKAFYSSWAGRAWRAIGLNPNLAESIGINIVGYKLTSFVVASVIAGMMGSFYVHYVGFVEPTNYGMTVNIYIQVYAILGGIGYAVMGPLVGAAAMTFFPELFQGASIISAILTGTLLVLLVIFLPGGLLSLFDKKSSAGGWISRMDEAIKAIIPTKRGTK